MQFPLSIKLTSRDRRHIIFKTDKREKDGSGEVNMTLYEAQKNQEYTIAGLFVEEAVTRRLQALGLNDGTKENMPPTINSRPKKYLRCLILLKHIGLDA